MSNLWTLVCFGSLSAYASVSRSVFRTCLDCGSLSVHEHPSTACSITFGTKLLVPDKLIRDGLWTPVFYPDNQVVFQKVEQHHVSNVNKEEQEKNFPSVR